MCTHIKLHPIVGGRGDMGSKERAHDVIITNIITTVIDCIAIVIHSRTGIPSAKQVLFCVLKA